MYYIEINEIPVKVSSLDWAKWYETANRTVAKTSFAITRSSEPVEVSTVFLGLDHGFNDGRVLLYETLVMGGSLDGHMDRYSTRQEAKQGHNTICNLIKDNDSILTSWTEGEEPKFIDHFEVF